MKKMNVTFSEEIQGNETTYNIKRIEEVEGMQNHIKNHMSNGVHLLWAMEFKSKNKKKLSYVIASFSMADINVICMLCI